MPQFRRHNTSGLHRTFALRRPVLIPPQQIRGATRSGSIHMFSTFRTLLLVGIALPLATGFAFAQTAPTVSPAPSAAPSANVSGQTSVAAPAASANVSTKSSVAAPGTSTTATTSAKTTKDLGAFKATPAEKKATHEKTSALTPSGKTDAVKTPPITPKH